MNIRGVIDHTLMPRAIEHVAPHRARLRRVLRAVRLEQRVLANHRARRLLIGRDDPRYRCILDTRPHRVNTASDVELHMLVCEGDFLRAMWALKSFLLHAGLDPHVFIHDDGTLSPSSRLAFQTHFDGCELSQDAAAQMQERLRDYPMCQFFRQKHAMAGKLLDVLMFSRGRYLIVVDSDILWFRPSEPVLEGVASGRPFYMPGGGEAYGRNRRFMEEHCDLHPARDLNAGLVGYSRADFRDFAFLDSALDRLVNVPPELLAASLGYRHPGELPGYDPTDPVESLVWWIMEQTLYALLFGRHDDVILLEGYPPHGQTNHRFGFLPPEPTTAAQHFISETKWNALFPIGVEHLLANGFLEAWARHAAAQSAQSDVSAVSSRSSTRGQS